MVIVDCGTEVSCGASGLWDREDFIWCQRAVVRRFPVVIVDCETEVSCGDSGL